MPSPIFARLLRCSWLRSFSFLSPTRSRSWRSAFPPIGRWAFGVFFLLVGCRRQSRFLPRAETTGKRTHIVISHLLQAVGDQSRATAATAVTNDRCFQIGHLLFDLQLDGAATEMLRAFRVIFAPIFFLANVDQDRVAALRLLPRFGRRNLRDVLLCLGHQFLKTIHGMNVRRGPETSMLTPEK